MKKFLIKIGTGWYRVPTSEMEEETRRQARKDELATAYSVAELLDNGVACCLKEIKISIKVETLYGKEQRNVLHLTGWEVSSEIVDADHLCLSTLPNCLKTLACRLIERFECDSGERITVMHGGRMLPCKPIDIRNAVCHNRHRPHLSVVKTA